jgi:3',5'-cyclic AMP phosphodiesterase CpdA
MSDLHYAPTPDADAGLERAYGLISSLEPDLIIVAGDLTHDGLTEQFDEVYHFLDRLGISRVRAIPGNRDFPAGNSTIGRPLDSDLEYFLGAPDTVFTDHELPGLTADQTPFTDYFADLDFFERLPRVTVVGLNSEPQIPDDAFKRGIDFFRGSSPSIPRIFCTHRSLLPVPRKKVKEGDLLKNASDILAELMGAKVRLAMCAHVHRAHAWRLSSDDGEIVVVNSPSLIDSSGSKETGFVAINMDSDGDVSVHLHTLNKGERRRLLRPAKTAGRR